MLKNILVDIKALLRFVFFVLLDKAVLLSRRHISVKTLLVVKLDAIGDYLLFRNFMEVIKSSGQYKDYKVTLCGNIVWRDLTQTFDKNFIDRFIWVDRRKFMSSILYRYKILRKIYLGGFEVVIHPVFSRDFFWGDSVVNISKAKERIGSFGDMSNMSAWQKRISDKWYTKLLKAKDEKMFEFERNREFFSQLIDSENLLRGPFIDVKDVIFNLIPKKPYAVICPGCTMKFRRWDCIKFSKIADFLACKYGLEIVIAGSSEDTIFAEEIRQYSKTRDFIDLTGRTRLSELSKMVSLCKILITNDSSALHIGAAVNAEVICIAHPYYSGRFWPYPESVFNKIRYICTETDDINDIKPEAVEMLIEQVLVN